MPAALGGASFHQAPCAPGGLAVPDLVSPSPVAAVLAEHRRLHGAIEAVEAALSAIPLTGTAGWARRAAGRLRDLEPLLVAHFAGEEDDGLFAQIEEAFPAASAACRHLVQEHRALLHRARLLAAQGTEATPPGRRALRAWRGEVRALLADLAAHEERENELLLSSLENEPGAPD